MIRRCVPLLILSLAVLTAGVRGQTMQMSNIWYGGRIDWPGGLNESRTDPDIAYRIMNPSFSVVSLISDYNAPSFLLADPALQGTTVAKYANDITDDLADFTDTNPGNTIRDKQKFFRVQPPTLIQDGSEILRTDWRLFTGDAVDASLTADQMFLSTRVYSEGLTVEKRTYAFANKAADDVIVEVTTITYPTIPIVIDTRVGERGNAPNPEIATLNPTLKNVYIGYNWFQQRGGSGPAGGAHIGITPEDGGRVFEAGLGALGEWDEINIYDDTEKLVYSYDGDASDRNGYRGDGDDRGEPAPGPGEALDGTSEALVGAGEFLESHYKGRLLLHVDKTPVTDTNTLSDNWLDDTSDPETSQPTQVRWVRGENWLSTDNTDRTTVYDFYVRPGTTRDERIQVSDPNVPGFTQPVSQIYQWMTAFGPWDISLGETIHIVTAAIVNGPSLDANKEAGLKWLNGDFTFAEKEAFLDSGFDSLMASVAAARQAWANRVGIAPKLDPVPSWPARFEVTSGPDRNELSWDSVSGAVSYNVYRMAGFHTRPRELVTNTSGTTYNDPDAIRGTRYYYSVTAVDAAGEESSFFATRTVADGVSPFRGPESDITKVRVVPNPYQIHGGDVSSGGFNFPGQPNKLLIVNLPAQAIVRIFTITGDLVTRIEHTSGSGDEDWPLMISDNNQFIASGIYFAHIEDQATGATHIERFVVVR